MRSLAPLPPPPPPLLHLQRHPSPFIPSQEPRSNRKEARQWLINSIADLDLSDAATKQRRFVQFLPGGAACRGAEHRQVAEAMLQLLFEAAPAEVSAWVGNEWGRQACCAWQASAAVLPLAPCQTGAATDEHACVNAVQVGALIAQDASLLRHFFKSDPKRVPLWFGHFRWAALASLDNI